MSDAKKQIRDMVRACHEQGLETGTTKGNHWYVNCPDGYRAYLSGTPSDHRAYYACRAKLRRHGVRV